MSASRFAVFLAFGLAACSSAPPPSPPAATTLVHDGYVCDGDGGCVFAIPGPVTTYEIVMVTDSGRRQRGVAGFWWQSFSREADGEDVATLAALHRNQGSLRLQCLSLDDGAWVPSRRVVASYAGAATEFATLRTEDGGDGDYDDCVLVLRRLTGS